MKVTVVQMNSQNCVERNLQQAARLIEEAHAANPADLYVLPEYAHLYGAAPRQIREVAEHIPGGPICNFFSELAIKLSTTIHCGTINEPSGAKVFNTSVIIGSDGEILCTYRKMHLIEATLAGGRVVHESRHFDRGTQLATFKLGGLTFGCTTCFDFRFPELFRALRRQGAEVLLFVTALSQEQGEAHHELLLRARAVETQSYLFAACQCGTTADGSRKSYGNSLIIDPWGRVVQRLGTDPGCISWEIDTAELEATRDKMDILKVADIVGLDRTFEYGRHPAERGLGPSQ